jgi:SAM-dependent methyltransferase
MNPGEFSNIARAEESFWWYRGMRQIMLRLLDPLFHERRVSRVLEAGCGTGHFAQVVARRYRTEVVGVDLAQEGLARGRALGVTELAQADLASLPFSAGSFDLALCMDVLVHFPRGQEGTAIAELARVLRPGGWLALRVSALDVLRSRHSAFAHERQRFTRGRLIEVLEGGGFHVRRCTYANALLLPAAAFKFRVWEPLTKARPESGVRPVAGWLDRLLYTPLAAEARWIGAGGGFPLGQSLIAIAEKS